MVNEDICPILCSWPSHMKSVVHRIFKVQSISDTSESTIVDVFKCLDLGRKYRLQTYPNSCENMYGSLLFKRGVKFARSSTSFDDIISIVETEKCIYWGISTAKEFHELSELTCASNSSTKTEVNKAEHKVIEALRELELAPNETYSCIDIGAAPGGWTNVLAKLGAFVVAVDPAEIPLAVDNDRIKHISGMMEDEDTVKEIEAKAPYDLLLCDVNCDVIYLKDLLVNAIKFLKPTAAAIITLKFRKNPSEAVVQKKFNDLRRLELFNNNFRECSLVWLCANTVNERTVLLRK
eukprot:TRINITY_DN1686_c0_g1_i1.p1 TRINITY_DN1686_c0_g1~~TRINITY_DN1686_c0_g1_i1.p1  ORF type:complete len:324 (-),score=56.18 TRINITY_DN1686_c0_g1_i1:79-957(-)